MGRVLFVAAVAGIFWWSLRGSVMGSRSALFGGRDLEPVAGAVAFTLTDPQGGIASLQVVDAVGGEARLLGGEVDAQSPPSWSPDHERVAYATSSTQVVRTVAGGDGDPIQVTAATEDFTKDSEPAWSPDGTQLAFLSVHRDKVAISSVHVVPAAGGAPRRIGPDPREYQQCFTPLRETVCQAWPTGDAEELAWLSGSELVYSTTVVRDDDPAVPYPPYRAAHGLYRADLDGSPPQLVAEIEAPADALVPSPDGRFLLYGQQGGTTRVLELASGRSWEIGHVTDPSWSADGGRLLFVRAGSVYTSSFDGSDRVNLTHTSSGRESSEELIATSAVWSPDGAHIAFIAGDGLGHTSLFVANADGTGWTEIFVTDGGLAWPHWLPWQS